MRRVTLVVVVLLLLYGCAEDEESPAGGEQVLGYADLVASLAGHGLPVEELGVADGTPFSVEAHSLILEGQSVSVYEYPDSESRERDSSTIAMAGWSVNNNPVEWTGNPHYWLLDRLIVLYLGDDASVITALTQAVGDELDLSNLGR
jgi:hypothetical protein